jgi:hypothetical protein
LTLHFKAGALVVAAGALAIAVPAAAHPGGSNHPKGNGAANGSSHSSGSHKCKPHKVAYIVHGTIDSSQGAITVTDGTVASGTLVVDVTLTNHWAKHDKTATQPVSYQLGPDTKVKFDGGATDFSSGERVNLIGKALVVTNKHCTGAATVGTPTVRMVVVHPVTS